MKNRGVLFYTDDTKPIPELVVALWSYLKHNRWPIHICFGPNTPIWFMRIIAGKFSNSWYPHRPFKTGRKSKIGHWLQKPYVIYNSPFDRTLYYDCDHLFLNPLPARLWRSITKHGLSTGHDNGDIINYQTFRHWRIATNRVLGGAFLKKSDHNNWSRVNGGCIGFAKNELGIQLWNRWVWFMNAFSEMPDNKKVMLVGDESALSVTINSRQRGWLGTKYSMTAHPYLEKVDEFPEDLIAFHYSRSQYKQDDARKRHWVAAYKEAREANFLELKDNEQFYLNCNPSINEELVN